MDIKPPKSEPTKSVEKPNIEKAEKPEIASKPNQKPEVKPKNKIEPRKIDPKKEPRHNLQPRTINPKSPPKHKLTPRIMDPAKESKHKLHPRNVNPATPSKHKIEPRKIDHKKDPSHKIQAQRLTPGINKTKIEKIPSNETKNTVKPEIKQPSIEQIKQEMKKFDWKRITENWNININANQHTKYNISLDPTEAPSVQNPLYRHKQWLQTVYNNPSWKLTNERLGKICGIEHGTIAKWRRKFNIPTKYWHAQNKLFFDSKNKECGRCHEIKPNSNFTFRRKKGILYPKSTCKKCDDKQKQIFALKNKIQVMKNIYQGKLGPKCPECTTGPEKLPALEFHHSDPALKRISWHERMYKNWEQTKEILEREKVKILCRNCHTKERTKIYEKYGKIIESASFNLESNNTEIRNYIRNYSSKPIKGNNVYNIEKQIKKKIIINKIYDGKCVGCEQITTQNNLPSLNFHHRDSNEDEGKLWSKISHLELKQIENELIRKNCVSLCGNCHQMIDSNNFKTEHENIISSEHWGKVKSYFEKLEKNVANFKLKKDND